MVERHTDNMEAEGPIPSTRTGFKRGVLFIRTSDDMIVS